MTAFARSTLSHNHFSHTHTHTYAPSSSLTQTNEFKINARNNVWCACSCVYLRSVFVCCVCVCTFVFTWAQRALTQMHSIFPFMLFNCSRIMCMPRVFHVDFCSSSFFRKKSRLFSLLLLPKISVYVFRSHTKWTFIYLVFFYTKHRSSFLIVYMLYSSNERISVWRMSLIQHSLTHY